MAGIRDERMEREEREGRRMHHQREEEEAARRAHWHHSQLLRSINRPLDVHGPAPKPRADGWDGHNDKCSDDTPNCNRLADIGIRVNGMPQDLETDTMASSPQAEGGASAVMKNRNVILATRGLAKMLSADARLATHLSRDGSSSISKARWAQIHPYLVACIHVEAPILLLPPPISLSSSPYLSFSFSASPPRR
jgi:hypothetical protein